jgi:acyl carrier protein
MLQDCFTTVQPVTAANVREFLTTKYADAIRGAGYDPATLSDEFDFLLSGAVDSFGVLEMVSAIEQRFGIELDLANLDAEQMTILGSLAKYVAESAK